MADRRGGGVAVEGKCGEKPSNCQLESPDMVVSPANRPSGRGDNCAETGAITADLLGATSRPPVCGVYQGGLSPSLVVCAYVTRNARNPESMFGLGEGPGSI